MWWNFMKFAFNLYAVVAAYKHHKIDYYQKNDNSEIKTPYN